MPTPQPVTAATLLSQFPGLFTEIVGSDDRTITGVNAPDLAAATEMIFLTTPKALEQGLKSPAQTLVVPPKAKAQVESAATGRTILISPNPEKAMALVINAFFQPTPYTNPAITGVHPTAVIDPTATLAASARIGPHAFIGAHVRIAANVYIGANSVIEDSSTIGDSTVIHPNVFIGSRTEIGSRCEIHPSSVIAKEGFGYAHDEKFNHFKIPHQGRVVIEDDVQIGACCTIDRATFNETRIQKGAILDNIIHIAHNCTIGRNAVATSGFTMAGSSKVGANFVTGGKTVISGHLEVCDNVQLSALSAVPKSISKPGSYGGHPIQPLQAYLRTQAAITHLPQMRKAIKKIAAHLGLEVED